MPPLTSTAATSSWRRSRRAARARPPVTIRTRTSPTRRTSSSPIRTRTTSSSSDEEEDDREDDVDREELEPLEPGRLALLGHVRRDDHREQDRADLQAAELE